MGDYRGAFNWIQSCGGETSVDGGVDTDWDSIEIQLSDYAKEQQSSTLESFFGEALQKYLAISQQARNEDGYRPSFNFSMLVGDPGTAQVSWH